MPDNPTLSEKVRDLNAWMGDLDEYYDEMQKLIPGILQALDANERLNKDFAIERCELKRALDRLKEIERNLHDYTGLNADIPTCIDTMHSDNERYRATIVQLEKERKEAIDRVQELGTLLRIEREHRRDTGAF